MLLTEVAEGLQDSTSMVEVLEDVRRESVRIREADKGIDPAVHTYANQALINIVEADEGVKALILETTPDDFPFFRDYAGAGEVFLDRGAPAGHGDITHLFQDAVVNKWLRRLFASPKGATLRRRLGGEVTSRQFRKLLGDADKERQNALDIADEDWVRRVGPGQRIWMRTYDAPYEAGEGASAPEDLFPILKEAEPEFE
jgi:hypothetical protein